MTDNYEKTSLAASRRFLEYDQEAILERWPLAHDDSWIYVKFVGEEYRIDRSTGRIYAGERTADFNEVLSILDMVCNSPCAPAPTGKWLTMTQLTNRAGSGPVSMDMMHREMEPFIGHPERLEAACRALGGTEASVGDVSFYIPVFENFPVWFQFWDEDEEFPASITFLWDSSTPQHLHYETLWYIMNHLLGRLQQCSQSPPQSP